MERQQELLCDQSNGAIFNDLEQSLTQISRSRLYLTLNMSETVRDRDIDKWNTSRDLHTLYSRVSFQMTLSDLAKYSLTRRIARSLCDS